MMVARLHRYASAGFKLLHFRPNVSHHPIRAFTQDEAREARPARDAVNAGSGTAPSLGNLSWRDEVNRFGAAV
jgi:hypothetical protein